MTIIGRHGACEPILEVFRIQWDQDWKGDENQHQIVVPLDAGKKETTEVNCIKHVGWKETTGPRGLSHSGC